MLPLQYSPPPLSPSPDLHRQMHRLAVPYNEPVNHPQKTVNAMRLLAAIPDNSLRVSVSHALYKVEHLRTSFTSH